MENRPASEPRIRDLYARYLAGEIPFQHVIDVSEAVIASRQRRRDRAWLDDAGGTQVDPTPPDRAAR